MHAWVEDKQILLKLCPTIWRAICCTWTLFIYWYSHEHDAWMLKWKKKYRCIPMNKFSFNLQPAFLFVRGTRDVIFKMKTRWHEGYEERKKCICCMVRNAVVFFFYYFWFRPFNLLISSLIKILNSFNMFTVLLIFSQLTILQI